MQLQKSLLVSTRETRTKMLLALTGSILAINGLVLLFGGWQFDGASDASGIALAPDISRIATITFAMVASLVVVSRQKSGGLFGRAFLSLAIGLVLWFAAEATWGYYRGIMQVDKPFPSIADALWLAGYGPLGYHLFSLSRFYAKRTEKIKVALVTAIAALVSFIIVQNIIAASELSSPDAFVSLGISIAYPVLDMLLIITTVLVVMNAGKGMLTAIPWIFISYLFVAVSDISLGFIAVDSLPGDLVQIGLYLTNTSYNRAYLFMAAGLLWHNRFFILDKKKMMTYSDLKEWR